MDSIIISRITLQERGASTRGTHTQSLPARGFPWCTGDDTRRRLPARDHLTAGAEESANGEARPDAE